ncbi:MAG TPA: hypothetical protein VNN73_00450 [Blastocatellia bacterium]|nr:hypothetical protein [Blastocatellia bacterium]
MRQAVEMNDRAGERGAIKIKVLLMLSVVALIIFAVVKIAPVYVEQREIVYKVDELARLAAVRSWKEDQLNNEIKKIRDEYSLPEDSIKVVSQNKPVKVTLGYTRVIDFLVTSYDWKVEYTATGKEL